MCVNHLHCAWHTENVKSSITDITVFSGKDYRKTGAKKPMCVVLLTF